MDDSSWGQMPPLLSSFPLCHSRCSAKFLTAIFSRVPPHFSWLGVWTQDLQSATTLTITLGTSECDGRLSLCSVYTLVLWALLSLCANYNNDWLFFPFKMVLSGKLFLFSNQLKNCSFQSWTLPCAVTHISPLSIMLLWGPVSGLTPWEAGGDLCAPSLLGSVLEIALLKKLALIQWGALELGWPEGRGWILGEVTPFSQGQWLGRKPAVSLPQPKHPAARTAGTAVPERDREADPQQPLRQSLCLVTTLGSLQGSEVIWAKQGACSIKNTSYLLLL